MALSHQHLKKTARVALVAWALLGLSLLLLIVIEVVCGAMIKRMTRNERLDPLTKAVEAGAMPESAWLTEYSEEFERIWSFEWRSYVYQRRRPFEGKFFNVDERGLRRTWRPDGSADGASTHTTKVFLFGGSTMWGSGARDDYTIPSCLSRQLSAATTAPVEVVNHGEAAYVSAQETLALMAELRRGNVPDIAIFYNGFNDAFSSFQNWEAGLPQNETLRRIYFDTVHNMDRSFWGLAFQIFLQNSGTYRLAQKLTVRRRMRRAAERDAGPDMAHLAAETVSAYAANVKMIEAMGRAFGFEVLFYWQPSLFDKAPLTDFESQREAELGFIKGFYLDVRERVEREPSLMGAARFTDLGGIFRDQPELRFLDYCHILEKGNQDVAGRMLTDVLPLVE